MKITEHNATTGEIIERQATEEEIAQAEIDAASLEKRMNDIEQQANARQSALEKLAKLGLSEEEVRLILG